MGLFDKIVKVLGGTDKDDSIVANKEEKQNVQVLEDIVLLPSYHMVEDVEFGDDDSKYSMSFQVNDSFKEAESHAGEVMMLHVYAPDNKYGEEGKLPYMAIMMDDDVYCPVEEYKESGTFEDAIEITPLDGKFYFKAKKEYYGDVMYFYGMDRCDGFWENNGLCMVYPKAYVGTENEKKLIQILDEAAASYKEEKMQ